MVMPLSSMELGPFIGGWNLRDTPTKVGASQLIDGMNVMLSRDGRLVPAPGLVVFNKSGGSNEPGYGLYRAYKSDGTAKLLRATDTAIQVMDDADNNKFKALTLTGITLGTAQRWRFATYNDIVYMVNGANAAMKWNFYNNTAVMPVGIEEPSSALTLLEYIEGEVDEMEAGNYYYVFKFYNSTYATESPCSPVSATITIGAELTKMAGVRLTIPAISGINAQINYVKIYRTQKDGSADGPFYYLDEVAYSGSAITYEDATADADLGPECDTDCDAPPDGAKYIISSDNMIFLAGFESYPNRIYYSRIGYPEYFTEPTTGAIRYLNVGRAEGDKITGLISRYGKIYIFKESSIWVLDNPTSPEDVNLKVITAAFGCIAPDSLVTDEKYIYFLAHEGLCMLDAEEGVHKVSGLIDVLFKDSPETSIPRSVLASASAVYHENRYLLSYSSKRTTIEGYVSLKITEGVATSGNNRKEAEESTDISALADEDAVYTLEHDQSSQNNYIKLVIGVPWKTDYWYQMVHYKIYFSYDNRTTWVEKLDQWQWATKKYADIWDVPPHETYTHEFYDLKVTDIRVDFIESYTSESAPIVKGPWQDYAFGKLNADLTLQSVTYYWDDENSDAVNDRIICFYTDRITYNPLLKEYLMACTPPWDYGARAFAVLSGGSDHNALLMTHPVNGKVYQLIDEEKNRDGLSFLAWFQTGHLPIGVQKGNGFYPTLAMVDYVKIFRYATSGKCTVECYVDMLEAIQEKLDFGAAKTKYGQNNYLLSHFGGETSIKEDGLELNNDAEGRYIGFRVWSEDGNLGDILKFMAFFRPLPEYI